jgi:hypothetical protein
MAVSAKEIIGTDILDVVADRGYYSGTEILDCETSEITTYIPRIHTSGSIKKGLFSKRDFKWIAKDNEYECPAGERLIWRFSTEEHGKLVNKYWRIHSPLMCLIGRGGCAWNTERAFYEGRSGSRALAGRLR